MRRLAWEKADQVFALPLHQKTARFECGGRYTACLNLYRDHGVGPGSRVVISPRLPRLAIGDLVFSSRQKSGCGNRRLDANDRG